MDYQKKLVLVGIGIGLCFPSMSIALELYLRDLSFSITEVRYLHQVNPLLWIIDSAPVVLGTIFYLLGRSVIKREHVLKKLNTSIENRIKGVSEFLEALNQNDFNCEYNSDTDNDLLQKILTKFREDLKLRQEVEQRRVWIQSGVAKFSELLRIDSSDLSAFCQPILSEIINYLNLSQGGIFVLDEQGSDHCLKLAASYAWNQLTHTQKRIKPGEGLVGQCWLERKKINLKKVPENYIRITSGLGDSLPRCVLILPLKSKEDVVGVLELASFSSFEPYQIEFLEKVAENIASVLITLKANLKMQYLLDKAGVAESGSAHF